MAEKYWRRLLTVSWKGATVWDGSFAANFARRHFSFRIGHAGPIGNPPFRPHGSPCESLLNTKKSRGYLRDRSIADQRPNRIGPCRPNPTLAVNYPLR
jgi:hypothetical protein